MSHATIARNYAEALMVVAGQDGMAEAYVDLIDAVAAAIEGAPDVRDVLLSPRVTKAAKVRLLDTALGSAPAPFRRFVAAVVKRGRQGLFRHIATEYQALVDVTFNRVRATVTLAREPNEALRAEVQAALAKALGKEVLAQFRTDATILGGTVVRIGDRVYDGSVRRRMQRLRRMLVG